MTPDCLATALRSSGALAAFRAIARRRGLVTIVSLHRVSPVGNAYFPPLAPDAFRDLCRYAKAHYDVVLLRDLRGGARRFRKPPLVLSFDDGYRDFVEYAVPIMLAEGIRANQNVITGCVDTGRAYTWQRCLDYLAAADSPGAALERLGIPIAADLDPAAIGMRLTDWIHARSGPELAVLERELDRAAGREPHPVTEVLSWDEVRELDRQGFEIGSHTVSHAALDLVNPAVRARELHDSRARLESELGHAVDVIAFPSGRYDAHVVEDSRRAGYAQLLAVDDELNRSDASVWKRVMVYGETPARVQVQATGFEAALRSVVRRRAPSTVSRVTEAGGTALPGLVSVVIPVYNGARYIAETIESVVGQTYKEYEVVVVDDGSTDETPRIVETFLTDRRVRYVRVGNGGVSAARNHGASLTRGEYLAFVDADDVWLPDNLAAKIAWLRDHPLAGLVHADVEVIDGASRRTGRVYTGRSGAVLEPLLLIDGVSVPGPSHVLFRRSTFERVGGYDALLSTAADQDMNFRVAAQYTIGRVPRVLSLYRVHGSNMHRNVALMERDHLLVFRNAAARGLFQTGRFRRRCLSRLYLILAGSWWHGGRRLRALGFGVRAFALNPAMATTLLSRVLRPVRPKTAVDVAS